MRVIGSIVVLASLMLGASAAEHGKDEPSAIVNSFHEALASGVIFEQGGAEMSRDEYASEHLDADIEFSRATSSKAIDQRAQVQGKSAWMLTISETFGSFRGKDVSSRNAETMVLAKTARGWHIVHIHWSSHTQSKP